ncbi:MAG: hypothetical protein WAX66_00595, partial [Patescibacteria group bacterium]
MERTRIFSLLKFYVVLGLSVVIGYFLSTLLWNHISLPFSNPYLASGKLAQIEFNPVNNYIRFIIFVLMPVLVFALSLLVPSVKKLVLNVFSSLGKDTESSNANGVNQAKASFLSEKFLIITLSLLVLFPCLVFAQEDFTTSGFDIFHEGEQITPAFNHINGKGTWSGTLFVHGAFYDMFTAVLGWKLFGVNSIGAYRITVELLKILVPVGLALLLFAIWRSFKDKTKDTSSLLVQTILFFYLVSLRIQNFDRRDVPLLFGMFFLIMALNKRSRVLYFVAGLFSSISAFYSLDMGIYFTALVILFVPVVALIKVYKPKDLATYSAYLFSGVIFGWVVFYSLVGHKEFLSFISNFGYFYKVKDLIDSYVYPFPSLLKSFRFTLPLILLSLNVLIYAVLFFFVYIKGRYKNEGVVHGLLTLISLIHYRSALGRSDLTHV